MPSHIFANSQAAIHASKDSQCDHTELAGGTMTMLHCTKRGAIAVSVHGCGCAYLSDWGANPVEVNGIKMI